MSVIDRTLGVPSPFLGAPFGAPSEILIGRSVALRTRVRTPCRVLRDTGMGFSGRAERNHYINFGPFRYTIDLEELIVLLLFFFWLSALVAVYTLAYGVLGDPYSVAQKNRGRVPSIAKPTPRSHRRRPT